MEEPIEPDRDVRGKLLIGTTLVVELLKLGRLRRAPQRWHIAHRVRQIG
ncbi:MAG: hypothetical protein WBX10_04125 [Candidatus Sulfotelmatobacter sp.]